MHYKMQSHRILAKIISTAHYWLSTDGAINEQRYLISRVDPECLDTFMFGYMPSDPDEIIEFIDNLGSTLKSFDPVQAMVEANLIYIDGRTKKPVSFFKNHKLLIPFYDVYGYARSISGRCLLPEEEQKKLGVSKYKHLPFKKSINLYGLNFSKNEVIRKNRVVLVEGQFDLITAYNSGIKNIAGLCGSSLTFEQIALLKRFCNNFDILVDNDEAGEKNWAIIKNKAKPYNFNARRIGIPDKSCKDIDLFLRNGGKPEELLVIEEATCAYGCPPRRISKA